MGFILTYVERCIVFSTLPCVPSVVGSVDDGALGVYETNRQSFWHICPTRSSGKGKGKGKWQYKGD